MHAFAPKSLPLLLVALAGACAGSNRPDPLPSGTHSAMCRHDDGLVSSVRVWLSLPNGPSGDTIGKNPGFFKELPSLPAREIVSVENPEICRRVAIALQVPRRDTVLHPVPVLRFGATRYLTWDLSAERSSPPVVTYYVLDDRFRVLSVVPTF
jgi:hypothetical protein